MGVFTKFKDLMGFEEYEEEEEQNPLIGDPQFKACQNLSGGI